MGIGISPQNRERIFNAFEQAEDDTAAAYGGTGLGLSISSRLVRMMGGEIGLEKPGRRGEPIQLHAPLYPGGRAGDKCTSGTEYGGI